MTYEQMEKTMQFILDQQAAMTTRQAEFEEGRKQLAAESAERDRKFEDWRKQVAAENAERDSQFQEWRKQLAAENADRDRQFQEWRKQLAAENADRDKRFEEGRKQAAMEFEAQLKQVTATFAEQNGIIYEMMERTHTDLATLSADALFFRDTGEDHEKRMNELNDSMNLLIKQVSRTSAKVEELTETVKNLVKGGSNGWTRN